MQFEHVSLKIVQSSESQRLASSCYSAVNTSAASQATEFEFDQICHALITLSEILSTTFADLLGTTSRVNA
jgi:hypothetical protein